MEEKKWVWLGSITLVTALIWVALDGYHQLVRQDRLGTVKELLKPIDPRLNTQVLKDIELRKEYQLLEAEKLLPSPQPPLPIEASSSAVQLEINRSTTESGISSGSAQQQ